MPRHSKRQPLVPLLILEFLHFLNAFERNCPFTRYGQLENHVRTITRRCVLGSATASLADEVFLKNLYDTLQSWGIGSRASKLTQFQKFATALQSKATEISELENTTIDQTGLDINVTSRKLWLLIDHLDIVTNEARLVAGSKALHHLLPNLVTPIDRAYTQNFFGWSNPEFQYGQERCFQEAFAAFVSVARAVNPVQYVTKGWNSSRTKVIDNAIVGMLCNARKNIS